MSSVLEVRGLAAGYGSRPVVEEVDLELHPGEVVALLGANGVGKSTTLMTLCGTLAPMAGTVSWEWGGRGMALHHHARRKLAYIPPERSVFMGLSTLENLRLGRGTPERALELFGELEPLLDRRAGLLSGGEQRILSVARALAAEPAVLLADELSLGLAPQIVRRLLRAIRQAADEGLAGLVVEQHVNEILPIADRAYVMGRGGIRYAGPAAELRNNRALLEELYLTEISANGSPGP